MHLESSPSILMPKGSGFSIRINPELFSREVLRASGRGCKAGLERAGLRGVKEAKDRAPTDTTSLQSSIKHVWHPDRRFLGGGYVTFGPNVKSVEGAPYDVYQEFGTGIYGPRKRPIKPRKAKHLTFKTKGGGWVSTKSVRGVKAVKYMQRALDVPVFVDEFVRGFNSVK